MDGDMTIALLTACLCLSLLSVDVQALLQNLRICMQTGQTELRVGETHASALLHANTIYKQRFVRACLVKEVFDVVEREIVVEGNQRLARLAKAVRAGLPARNNRPMCRRAMSDAVRSHAKVTTNRANAAPPRPFLVISTNGGHCSSYLPMDVRKVLVDIQLHGAWAEEQLDHVALRVVDGFLW
jgi:hypothetical protein